MAAVKLPSLPPPTATPRGSGRPSSAATFDASANSSAVADSGIGGRFTPPRISSVAAGSTGVRRGHRRFEADAFRRLGHPDVDANAGLGRHHVVGGAGVGDRRRHGRAA